MSRLKNKKVLIPLIVVLVLGYGGYSFAMPKPHVKPPKIAGTVYLLPQSFLINLSGGQYVKLSVALVLAKGQSDGASATASPDASNQAGDVLGTLPEEAVIRDIITNIITGQSASTLIDGTGRDHIKQEILQAIAQHTDVKVTDVLFPDLAVQ